MVEVDPREAPRQVHGRLRPAVDVGEVDDDEFLRSAVLPGGDDEDIGDMAVQHGFRPAAHGAVPVARDRPPCGGPQVGALDEPGEARRIGQYGCGEKMLEERHRGEVAAGLFQEHRSLDDAESEAPDGRTGEDARPTLFGHGPPEIPVEAVALHGRADPADVAPVVEQAAGSILKGDLVVGEVEVHRVAL